MHIAFIITSTGWGGLEMNTIKLAKLLTEKEYSITLITQDQSTIYNKGKELFTSTILLKKNRKYFDFKAAKAIGTALKIAGINTIVVFDNKDIDVIAWVKKLFYPSLKVVYQQHMQIGINKKDLLHTFRFGAIDWWISPLHYLKNEVADRTNFPVERVKVIPLCVDVPKFIQPKYTKLEALQALNISPKGLLIGIIGRISEKKGQLFLVESLIKLNQFGVDVELLIFGSPTVNDKECIQYNTNIHKLVTDNKLESIVHFVEYRDDVELFYNAVDVFVLASQSETYGMVTIEAMLSSLPIIATRSGGTSEILNYGKLGQLFEYGNHNEFCQKVLWILKHKAETLQIANTARQQSVKKYAQENEITAIDELLQSLKKIE